LSERMDIEPKVTLSAKNWISSFLPWHVYCSLV